MKKPSQKKYSKKPPSKMPPQHGPLGSTVKPIGAPVKPVGPVKLKAARPDPRQTALNAKGKVAKRKDLEAQEI